jgi:MscS family membrane protein
MLESILSISDTLAYYKIAGNINILTLLIAVLICLFAIIVKKIFTRYIFPALHKITARTGNYWDDRILDAFLHPLEWMIVITGIFAALNYIPFNDRIDHGVLTVYRSAVIILITWGIYDIASTDFLFSEEFKNKYNIDKLLVPLLSRTIRLVVLALAFVILIEEWGYEVSGLIAGLGIGGLAFALAAQHTLSNMFGGIVIISDKPFSIGDWIKTPSVEGVVEDISFRNTRVRAFDQSLITVPNSTLANEPVTNFTRMGKRRISFNLGLTYNTSRAKLQECVARIKDMLANHKDVHPETILVSFNEFNDSSLDIFIYFFTLPTSLAEFLAVRENINFEILAIVEELGISIAFPSRSIYLENIRELRNN